MHINDKIHGFTVTAEKQLPELAAVMYRMQHDNTGLELVWLSRKEENKTFGIAFETLPWDDTGVFHILEHSVLCGSDKFPVKEPFVELLKNSMNTFLNAMTFPDKTFYPVSSRNDKDFFNLMRVYLDAVFHPAIYRKPEIFCQEGWHYEFDENGAPSYKGVVFNEMKGAFADADETMGSELCRALFPESPYSCVSGGDPAKIPDLTYEKFIESHRKFYSPSNGYVILDGEMDIDAVLGVINDEFLTGFERTARIAPPVLQKAVDGGTRYAEYELGPDEEIEGKTRIAWGSMAGTFDEREKLTAINVLSTVLCGSNQAPLCRVILSDNLAENVSMRLQDGTMQQWVKLELMNLKAEDADAAENALFGELKRLADEGIDRTQLEAAMANMEFQMRERDFGSYPQGLIFGFSILESWLYGGAPEANLEVGDLFDRLRKKMNEGYFEQLIRDVMLNNPHSCKVVLTPSHTVGDERRAKEAKRLADEAASWSESYRAEMKNRQEALEEWQNSANTPEQLATLPHLDLCDVSDMPEQLPEETTVISGIPAFIHKINCGGILYVSLYFNADGVTGEQLSQLSFVTELLGQLDTAESTVDELTNRIRLICGNLQFYISCVGRENDTDACRISICAAFSTLEKNLDKALELVCEILTKTKFDDSAAVLDILRQTKTGAFQSIVMSGHAVAVGRVSAQISASSAAGEYAGGVDYYKWLKDNESRVGVSGESQKLGELFAKYIGKTRLVFSVTGDNKSAPDEIGAYLDSVLGDTAAAASENIIKPFDSCREGIIIPADISFAVCGGKIGDFSGEMALASKIISLGYLWDVIRVQGGAYGAGMLIRNTGFAGCYSFRDPSGAKSLEKYKNCGSFLRSFCEDENDLTGFIIGTVSDASPLLTPRMKGAAADDNILQGVSYEKRCEHRKELLGATYEQLIAVADRIDAAINDGSYCIVGGTEQVDAVETDSIITL